jgi:hypothetical protein
MTRTREIETKNTSIESARDVNREPIGAKTITDLRFEKQTNMLSEAQDSDLFSCRTSDCVG